MLLQMLFMMPGHEIFLHGDSKAQMQMITEQKHPTGRGMQQSLHLNE